MNLLDDDSGGLSPSPHVEILNLTIRECFVYKVPPLRSASGHRAEDWNLASPVFTGCLKIFQADTKVRKLQTVSVFGVLLIVIATFLLCVCLATYCFIFV